MKPRNALLPLASILFAGCLEHPITHVEICKIGTPELPIKLEENGDVDILFVIDNSGSMAEEQSRLARNFEAFAARLDTMGAHYRIGFTTTDSGNPRCSGTTPEGGDLVLRSCLDRLGEGAFQFNDIDAAYACTDVCSLTGDQLAVRPSTASGASDGQEAKPRPWIEKIDGVSNLPGGVSMADAFACFGPQGIDGCGFEQPLESMYRALQKALEPSEGNHGFMRDNALLSVIFVTDETDCSYDPGHSDIFTSDKTFWESPDDPAPTSALCWNAGVACQGPGPVYDGCEPEDYAADGTPGAADGVAVLRPVSRYTDFLAEIQGDKQAQGRDVLLSLIAGVPIGYEKGGLEIPYQEAADGTDQQRDFGIAPGCVAQDGSGSTAIPPVRERVVAEAFAGSETNLYSICQDDYTPALEGIARQIQRKLVPVCGTSMVADSDPATDTLEPDCKIQQTVAGETTDVVACEPVGEADWAVPAGHAVCAIVLTDADGSTKTTRDDMTLVDGAAACAGKDTNVEFKLKRSGPRVVGAEYSATCVSQSAERCE